MAKDNDRGQNLIAKYVWVVETIYRARRITFDALNRQWRKAEIGRGVDLPKRTFAHWIKGIKDMFGLTIENENKGEYRYYIANEDDIRHNGLRSWVFNTVSVSNSLAHSQSVKQRILLEDVPSGQRHLEAIIQAMKANRVLNLTYQSYGHEASRNFDVQPMCVKLFRRRWYLLAQGTYGRYAECGPLVYALDRIHQLQPTDRTFALPKGWDAEEYFATCFGVMPDMNTAPQLVRLKVDEKQACYFRSLPLHPSQDEDERNAAYSIFSFYLRPTYDFQQEILRYGDKVEVLEPQWLRNEIAARIQRMLNFYLPQS
ncbi:MAG: WYL domain-containing protein [Bacteroidaceae bacterium]|nr:WYL domain-containing protein [Bacteroidaceae bacterium]